MVWFGLRLVWWLGLDVGGLDWYGHVCDDTRATLVTNVTHAHTHVELYGIPALSHASGGGDGRNFGGKKVLSAADEGSHPFVLVAWAKALRRVVATFGVRGHV